MLWYRVLQNTICCGTLHVTPYRLYANKGQLKCTPVAGTHNVNSYHQTEICWEEV